MTTEKDKRKGSFLREYTDLLVLLVVSIFCYGLLIPWLGYYWDDWAFLWIANTMGHSGLVKYLFDSRIYELVVRFTTSLLGTTPWVWHVFGVLSRWCSAITFWWLLRLSWPGKKGIATWGSLLFLVFPGFIMQFIPINFGHFFIFVTFFLLSLCLNVLATRKRKWFWLFTPLALFFSFLNLAGWENYFVLELMRPVLLWFVLNLERLPSKKKWKTFLITWSPYLVLFILIAVWRAFLFSDQTVRYQYQLLEMIKANPITGIFQFFGSLFGGIFTAFLGGWAQAFRLPEISRLGQKTTLAYALIVGASLLGLLAYVFFTRQIIEKAETKTEKKYPWQLILSGGIGVLVAGAPYLLINLLQSLSFPNNRFIVSYMPGAVMLLLGLIYYIPQLIPKFKHFPAIFFSVLIAFSIGSQFANANVYRRDWNFQQRFFWQLAWRIPSLQPGTVLLINEFTDQLVTDNSITAPVNWMYAPNYHGGMLPYDVFFPTIRLGGTLPGLEPGLSIEHIYRPVTFVGSTSQAVTLEYNPPGCLRVLDPQLDPVNAMLTPLMRNASTISSTTPIVDTGSPHLPANIFGTEPDHNWCYYFEKADLARQQSDWAQVVSLGEQAFNLSDFPNDPAERIPFIEGYAHTGDWAHAVELTSDSAGVTPLIQPVLCKLWQRIYAQTSSSPEKTSALTQVSDLLACTLP